MNSEQGISSSDIAIIGMSGRFPGAAGLEQFWDNLCQGREGIRVLPDDELLQRGVDPNVIGASNYVKAVADIRDIEFFDNTFFGFTPRDAEIMDPQLRLLLECAWATIEHAGYNVEDYPGAIGVYAGAAPNSYFIENLVSNREFMRTLAGPLSSLEIFTASDALSTMVSFKLNLRGPSITIQTACSTSLVSVHLACQSLLSHESDMALAGGVNLNIPQERGYVYQKGMILSPDGHCRPFDAVAAGTVFGGGVGLVLLKRLSDALADSDCIHAVIKGSAINNDGSRKAGFTAPSVVGQAGAIADALAIADVPADSIGYVEAHGTGTSLGDPIEVEALTRAFRQSTHRNKYCGIGSVKSNIGHLDRAAGIASLIKTILSLKHGEIPATLHFKRPNPNIDFDATPFYVVDKLTKWKSVDRPRRAVVNSVGFGGTNACVILEEAPAVRSLESSRSYQLLTLSARSESALDEATNNLAEHFEKRPETNLANAAYTLHVGRQAFDFRRVAVCQDVADAVEKLTLPEEKGIFTGRRLAAVPSVVFMFPGQGAQYAGMAAELYQSEPIFRAEVGRCTDVLLPFLKSDLCSVLFPAPGQEEEAGRQLLQTRFTQPALFVIEYALAKLWMSWGIKPAAMIGHSVGEYVAGCLAGVFTLEDALALVAERAALVQAQPSGAMLSVRLSEKDVLPLLNSHLAIAAINSPNLCVVSGPHDAVGALEKQLQSRGVIARHLHTSHAFHSFMMEPVLAPFTEVLRRVKFSEPRIPYVSNVTAEWITARQATSPEYWAGHVRQTVRFSGGLTTLFGDGPRLFLEVGPGQTLSQMVHQHPAKQADTVVLASLSASRHSSGDTQAIHEALGKAWIAGMEVDWRAFHVNEERYRVPLPTYPFDKKAFWVKPPQVAPATVVSMGTVATANDSIQEKAEKSTTDKLNTGRLDNGCSTPTVPIRCGRITEKLQQILQELSGIHSYELEKSVTFLEMGLDSLFLAEFSRRFEKEFGVSANFRELTDATLEDLALYLDQKLPPDNVLRQPAQQPEASHFPGAIALRPRRKRMGDELLRSQLGPVEVAVSSAKPIAREARFDEKELAGILTVLRRTFPVPYEACSLPDFIQEQTHKWLANPARTSEHAYGYVLESPTDGIVGFVGQVPLRIKIGEREIVGASGVSFGVLPTYRNYSLILNKLFMEWGEKHFELSTTANETSATLNEAMGMHPIPVKDFSQQLLWLLAPEVAAKLALGRSRWKALQWLAEQFPGAYLLKGMARLWFVRHRRLRFTCPKLSVEPVVSFTEEFNDLWEKNKKDYDITTVRDRAFLNWRHCEAGSLVGRTSVFACRDHGQIRGYIAVQVRAHESGYVRGHYVVTDLFYERTRKDVLYNLMNYAFEFAKARGCTIFQVSGFSNEVVEELKMQRPYIRKDLSCPYWYQGSPEIEATLCDEKRWWPSGADGDSNL